MQVFTSEVGSERSPTVRAVLQSLVTVCTERTREHTDVPEDALQGQSLDTASQPSIHKSVPQVACQECWTSCTRRRGRELDRLVDVLITQVYLKVLRGGKRTCQEQGARLACVDTDPDRGVRDSILLSHTTNSLSTSASDVGMPVETWQHLAQGGVT